MKITIRPTPRQVLGRALFIAAFACAVALLPAAVAMALSGRWRPLVLLALAAGVLAFAIALAYWSSRRAGVVLDEHGIHPIVQPAVSPKADRYAHWTRVGDIRAERRRGRTVPVVYLLDDAQQPWRLRAPYSGRGMAADPELDEKIFVMRSLWETYKSGRPPRRTFRA
ncbi:hypothetical protein L0U85_08980 [Glycomyces sp. L485]|uniref:hypothetical protein n=1 Tax=Glycomyces sp. L485 TaxID=2909235 RepID=UPI001F4ACFE4|nr:hypothetical protein [Glycomyces sp. L485]MCH7230982.1 hypothetical protein [Glycomyces sp. L485]